MTDEEEIRDNFKDFSLSDFTWCIFLFLFPSRLLLAGFFADSSDEF